MDWANGGTRPAGQGPSGSSAPGKHRDQVGFGTCRGERKANAAGGLDDAGGDFQETKTQRCELGGGQFPNFWPRSRPPRRPSVKSLSPSSTGSAAMSAFIAGLMSQRVPFIVCALGRNVDPFTLARYHRGPGGDPV
jgi:hypothetical protein